MSWKNEVKNWDGKLYKVLQGRRSCHGGDFEWSLPKGGKPGDWTPVIEDVEMCERGYHLTTHYAHWSDKENVSVYEAEGDIVEFDGYNKVVCTRARLLKLVENPFSENNIGKNNSGEYNSGNYNSGNWNSGNWNSGDRNSGYDNSGDRNSGDRNSGDFNSGDWNSGVHNCGDNNYGDDNSGNDNLGNYNSGNYNSGNYNSGDYNLGNYNSGYFCTGESNKMFNKSIPKDCKPIFTNWIYFELLPEGYHASWQKAFESADVNGIKELLALPNFNYEIFEEITSITKKQIEDKINGILYKKLNILKIKKWDKKLYKVLQGNKSCYGGNFEWSLPEGDKPGDWTPVIEDVEMCVRGYHLTTHYAHWSDEDNVSVYEAEGDVVEFNDYDKVVCTRARLLRLIENPFNKNNIGKNNSGYENTGNCNSGNCNSGYANSGFRNSGNCNSDSWNSGYRNIGNRNSGNYNSGGYNSGNFNIGNYNSGDWNSGDCNSGNHNSGNKNSGNWNSGDCNYGYFCTGESNKMFNKSIPKDWKPIFPIWMNFNLLSEGYHASWQKAFESADVEGIKELLALPNFNYEIFEEITSITKEQIEEKLGE